MAERVAIIGIGLIGGSLALALREAGFCREIAGVSNDPGERDKALELGVVDEVHEDPAAAVEGADLTVVAVPLGAFGAVFDRIAGAVGGQAVITDVGSAKGSVVEQARLLLGEALPRFVPGHPIAGTERNGVEAAFAGLYRGHRVILTPLPETDPGALERVRAMWRAAGAEPEEMEVDYHDRILAATSRLPHMLAYSLVDCLAQMEEAEDLFRLAAGGFEDFTRIASSSPEMWRDIVFANREALLGALYRYAEHLQGLIQAIERGDGEAVVASFRRAKQARDAFVSRRRGLLPTEHGEC